MRSWERTFKASEVSATRRGGGDILAGGGWYLQHLGEVGEAFAQWDCKVGKCVEWKMFTHRGRGDWGAPVQ